MQHSLAKTAVATAAVLVLLVAVAAASVPRVRHLASGWWHNPDTLAGLFDPGLVLATLGALLVLFCAAQMLNPYLLRVEDKEWLDRLAASRSPH